MIQLIIPPSEVEGVPVGTIIDKPECCICHTQTQHFNKRCSRCSHGSGGKVCETCVFDAAEKGVQLTKCPTCNLDGEWWNKPLLITTSPNVDRPRRCATQCDSESLKNKLRFGFARFVYTIAILFCGFLIGLVRKIIVNECIFDCYGHPVFINILLTTFMGLMFMGLIFICLMCCLVCLLICSEKN